MLQTVLRQKSAGGQRVDGHGLERVEQDLHALGHVGEIEAVEADVDRQKDVLVLGQTVGHDHGVENFLVIFDIDLQPAGVTHGQGVLRAAP